MLHRITTQIGTVETDQGVITPAVVAYMAAAGVTVDPTSRTVPNWSAALVAWAAIDNGIAPPDAAQEPASWLTWGGPLAEPQTGAVAVMTDGAGRGMLLGVVARVQGPKVYVVGAYGGAVQMRGVELGRVIAARRPPAGTRVHAQPVLQRVTVPAETVQIVHVPVPVQVPVQIQPPVLAPMVQQIIPPQPPQTVSTEALQRLLSVFQDEVAEIHDRIATVERTAIAGIAVEEQK